MTTPYSDDPNAAPAVPSVGYNSISRDPDVVMMNDEPSPLFSSTATTRSSSNKSNKSAAMMILTAGLLLVVLLVQTTSLPAALSTTSSTFSLADLSLPLLGRSKHNSSRKSRRDDVDVTSDRPEDDDDDDAPMVDDDSSSSRNSSGGSKHHGSSHSSSSSSKVRKCTFLECWQAGCSWTVAPFVCLMHNGGPQLGCSAKPWTPESCDEQCDLSDCKGMEASKDAESVKHAKCSDEWCCGPQRCPTEQPYQCVEGAARFGCHDDQYQWSVKVDKAACSEWCDTKTCSDINETVCDDIAAKAARAAKPSKTERTSSASAAASGASRIAFSTLFAMAASFMMVFVAVMI